MGLIDYSLIFVVIKVTFWCSVKIQRCHVQVQELIWMMGGWWEDIKKMWDFFGQWMEIEKTPRDNNAIKLSEGNVRGQWTTPKKHWGCWAMLKTCYLFIYLLTTKGLQEKKLGEAKDIRKCQGYVQGTLNNIKK
jgi:hypothetical protein